MATARSFVLVHSPLVGPYSWALVADALRSRGRVVMVPTIRSLENHGPPFWERHVEAITREITGDGRRRVVLVAHSGASRLLPICGQRIEADVSAYVFVDSDIPVRTESRFDGMPSEIAQQIRNAAEDGLLPPWPEEVFEHEIHDAEVRRRLVAELAPLPIEAYEETIPLPPKWPDAKCAYIRLSDRYPAAEAHAERERWPVHRFDGDHFHILVAPDDVAAGLIAITSRRH